MKKPHIPGKIDAEMSSSPKIPLDFVADPIKLIKRHCTFSGIQLTDKTWNDKKKNVPYFTHLSHGNEVNHRHQNTNSHGTICQHINDCTLGSQ